MDNNGRKEKIKIATMLVPIETYEDAVDFNISIYVLAADLKFGDLIM